MIGQTIENDSARGPAYKKGRDGIGLRHMANVAQQIANQAEHNEALRRAVNAEAVPGIEGGEDVGDSMLIDSPTTTNHYHSERKGLGTIAKLALGVGMIATGAGIPFGVATVLDAMKGGDDKIEKPAPINGERPGRKYLLDLGG